MPKTAEHKKILIVEDELMLLDVLADSFLREGFSVIKAKDGIEGLAMATKERPDAIIIDILMPKMDGITMLQKIRATPEIAKTPAVILTNLSNTKTIQQALESGAYDFLIKTDWEPKSLVQHVKEKLAGI